MNILVNNMNEINENQIFIKPKDIICPECGDISKINIIDYKISFDCKNGHKTDIFLDEYNDTQKLYISKIICDECKEKNKGNRYNNKFFKSYSCNKNLCIVCKEKHNNEHKNKIIDYDVKDYICGKHNTGYNSYCKTCQINLCPDCTQGQEKNKEHKDHKNINYEKELPDMKIANNYLMELKDKIKKFKIIIEEIIMKLDKVKKNIDYFYDINKDILNSYINKNTNYNYEIIYNFNMIK